MGNEQSATQRLWHEFNSIEKPIYGSYVIKGDPTQRKPLRGILRRYVPSVDDSGKNENMQQRRQSSTSRRSVVFSEDSYEDENDVSVEEDDTDCDIRFATRVSATSTTISSSRKWITSRNYSHTTHINGDMIVEVRRGKNRSRMEPDDEYASHDSRVGRRPQETTSNKFETCEAEQRDLRDNNTGDEDRGEHHKMDPDLQYDIIKRARNRQARIRRSQNDWRENLGVAETPSLGNVSTRPTDHSQMDRLGASKTGTEMATNVETLNMDRSTKRRAPLPPAGGKDTHLPITEFGVMPLAHATSLREVRGEDRNVGGLQTWSDVKLPEKDSVGSRTERHVPFNKPQTIPAILRVARLRNSANPSSDQPYSLCCSEASPAPQVKRRSTAHANIMRRLAPLGPNIDNRNTVQGTPAYTDKAGRSRDSALILGFDLPATPDTSRDQHERFCHDFATRTNSSSFGSVSKYLGGGYRKLRSSLSKAFGSQHNLSHRESTTTPRVRGALSPDLYTTSPLRRESFDAATPELPQALPTPVRGRKYQQRAKNSRFSHEQSIWRDVAISSHEALGTHNPLFTGDTHMHHNAYEPTGISQ